MPTAPELLIPVKNSRPANGRWKLPKLVTLAGSPQDALALSKTADVLAGLGVAACMAGDDQAADIRLVRDSRIAHSEGYRLTIAPKGVVISASGDAGAYYGSATLRGLLRVHGLALPCQVIDDAPAFARRAVYFDTARGKVPRMETLTGLVDRLAEWKINEFQIYVENAFAFRKHPAIARGYSPITPDEITALQDYCKARHVKLVGSLASFGHMEKALRLPQYAHLSELPDGATLCPTDPRSIKFVADMYAEFVPLFEAEDFNVCCDETWDLGRGRSQAVCQKRGTGRVYLDFLLQIRKLCGKYGKRMNAWSDIILQHPELLGDLPRDIVMCNWGYDGKDKRLARTNEIARAGLPLMVCPGTGSWQSIGSRWPMSSENICFAAEQGLANGAQGILNTDWGDFGHRQTLAVSLMAFALGAAESWRPGSAKLTSFPQTFALHAFGDRTGKLGSAIHSLAVTYRKGEPEVYRDWMYFNLEEPLAWGDGNAIWYKLDRRVSRYTPQRLQAMLTGLPSAADFAAPQLDGFDTLTMTEYALSARLYALFCLRSSLAWQIGLGNMPARQDLRGLADEIDRLAADYSTAWLARNKPSRLRDNMKLFRRASAEARRLAR